MKPIKSVKKEPPAAAPSTTTRSDPSLIINLITAAVFLGVGFVAGYVFKAQTSHGPGELQDESVAAAPPAAATSASASGALPPGHPPVNTGPVVESLQQQATANPQDPGPPLKLADFLYDQGDFQQAIVWYEKAVALDPNNVNASTDLGTCYFNAGRPDDALRQFRHSLAIEPGHQPTLFNMIVVNMEGKRDYKAALQAYDVLYRLNPNYPKLDELKQKLDAAERGLTAP